MNKKIRTTMTILFLSLFTWLSPIVAQEAWADWGIKGVSAIGALYTVNYIHEGGHWIAGETLGYDVDMEVHPFSGHADVEKRNGRLKDHDRGKIAIAGSLTTRLTYELANGWLLDRPHDAFTPYLSMAALGLRLDLPYQQAKAGVNHWRGGNHDDDDDIAQFYEYLPGGKNEVRMYHFAGAALSLVDLLSDSEEIMAHISGVLGEEPLSRRGKPRHWDFGMSPSGAHLDWSIGF